MQSVFCVFYFTCTRDERLNGKMKIKRKSPHMLERECVYACHVRQHAAPKKIQAAYKCRCYTVRTLTLMFFCLSFVCSLVLAGYDTTGTKTKGRDLETASRESHRALATRTPVCKTHSLPPPLPPDPSPPLRVALEKSWHTRCASTKKLYRVTARRKKLPKLPETSVAIFLIKFIKPRIYYSFLMMYLSKH